MKHETRIPHTLRLSIFFLRVVLGLNFFILGFGKIFNSYLASGFIQSDSLSGLRYWITSPVNAGWVNSASQWSLLIIGLCLVIGLATRFMSFLGIVLTAMTYFAGVNLLSISMSDLINDQMVILICLFIFIIARAGEYLGLDKFIHFSLRNNRAI